MDNGKAEAAPEQDEEGAERLPWTSPSLESAEVSGDTAATNLKVVHENPNSLS